MSHVLFLLVPQLHLLDLAGPAQVFSTAADLGYDYTLGYVAEREEVPTAQGVPIRAGVVWPVLGPEDLVVVPGWRSPVLGDNRQLDASSLRRLSDYHRAGGTVASVCAGAFALARAGLLDGRRCTTHHDLQDELARRYPKATVVRDVLYVGDGRVITSAGIASGIDLALHLVAVRHGPGVAARIARSMVVYARRNGEEQQASAMLRHRSHLSDVVHRVQDLIDARFTTRLALADLAAAGGVSQRTLTRLFGKAAGMTPLRYQQVLRVERAEHLIGHGATVEAAGHPPRASRASTRARTMCVCTAAAGSSAWRLDRTAISRARQPGPASLQAPNRAHGVGHVVSLPLAFPSGDRPLIGMPRCQRIVSLAERVSRPQ